MSRHLYSDQIEDQLAREKAIERCDLIYVHKTQTVFYEIFNFIEWVDCHGRIYFRELVGIKRAKQ